MTTENSNSQEQQPKPILSYIWDLPNICSLAGLGCTLLAIYFIILGVYPAAMIGMIWAVAFDWADGLVARRMKGRTGADRIFGGQVDLLIDIVSYGVTPAILILSYGNFAPVFLPVVFVMLVFGVIRLSYFSTFGLAEGAKYTGLAIDNNSLFLVFLFLFESLFSKGMFSVILAASGLALAILNVSQIKTPKLSGNPVNVFILAFYTLGITIFYGWRFL
ncbi:MAG: CDP-alcohol phosphatidyltransferase family protein [Hyphomicrobiaceae bacterium]|nr:CDP-alcohol phosphatidyltransferase family protein [Hyphomicrobiaceae bacterium]